MTTGTMVEALIGLGVITLVVITIKLTAEGRIRLEVKVNVNEWLARNRRRTMEARRRKARRICPHLVREPSHDGAFRLLIAYNSGLDAEMAGEHGHWQQECSQCGGWFDVRDTHTTIEELEKHPWLYRLRRWRSQQLLDGCDDEHTPGGVAETPG